MERGLREIASRLVEIRQKYENHSLSWYAGNPFVHEYWHFSIIQFWRAFGSRSLFNAGAIDTLAKEVQAGLMFGGPLPAKIPYPTATALINC